MSRPPSAARVQRLLAMVPWIAANDGPTLDEVAERFGITRDEVADDLEVVWLVGLPPYTPDVLIDVVQEGDRVWIHYPEMFARAHRLTPEQGLALLAAGASLLALPGAATDGPLARGVRKLADVLGVDVSQALEVDLGTGHPEVLEVLRAGVREHRRVRLDYYSYGRDARSERDVDPVQVAAEDGALYLLADCHLAGGPRRFRVDRIQSATLLDDRFEPAGDIPSGELFEAADDDPRVELELDPAARWVAENYPVEHLEELGEGRLRIRLAVSAVPWFERLLLQTGPAARVLTGPPELQSAGRLAAERILARYRPPVP